MSAPLVWLVGAQGMLGQETLAALVSRGTPHVSTDLECDITDVDAVRAFAARSAPTTIVNCAAYTAVDRAESEEARAFAINAQGASNLGLVAAQCGATLVHVSTDYVFDGEARAPYTEDAPLAPQGAYGRSKAEGERRLLDVCPRALIVRTAWLYAKRGPSFPSTMLRLFAQRDEVGVVADQQGTPTYAPDLAAALVDIVARPAPPAGVYHFTNAGETTWFGFASRIQERALALRLLERPCRVRPITTAEYPTPARRPAYSVLDKSKIARTFGITPRPWEDALEAYLSELRV